MLNAKSLDCSRLPTVLRDCSRNCSASNVLISYQHKHLNMAYHRSWSGQGIRLKSQDMYPYLPEAARRPSTTTGIWHLLYDSDAKITEVWFLRELSVDEYYRKVRVWYHSRRVSQRAAMLVKPTGRRRYTKQRCFRALRTRMFK